MSEADWWLCSHCRSLNNLSARKCYSCRRGKPRDSVRASEYLGYVPLVDQNGKVALADITPPATGPQLGPAANGLRPLRDPIRRDTLAVAPRPPDGARITYRPPTPPPLVATGPGPGPAPPAQRVAVPVIPIPGQTEPWAHWGDLLDVPRPTADRLRAAYSRDHAAATTMEDVTGSHGGAALTEAMKRAHLDDTDQARTFETWPANDRPPSDRPTGGGPTPPPTPTQDEP